MINLQPVEKVVNRSDGSLEVFKIWRTIQGEGPLVGIPAIFIRLAGCDLQCPLCDTDYTSNRNLMAADDIVTCVEQERGDSLITLVVITGGEPLRQSIGRTIKALLDAGFTVQIETNGTLYQEDVPWDRIIVVCSPKTVKLNPLLESKINAYKYVVSAGEIDDDDGLPTSVLGMKCKVARPWIYFPRRDIHMQPADEGDEEKNKLNLQATIDSCFKFGYRLCLQQHKQIGLE